jgi:tetratricopeptide (TPR) repeat protein
MYIRRGFLDQGIEALGELAELQRAQGQIKDAIQSLDAAADVHWTLGSHDKCYAIFDRMLAIAPNDIEVRTKLSNYYLLSSNIVKAVEEQKRIAKICVQQRNYQEAIGALHGAIALAPNDTDALEQLAELLMRVQEYAQALRIYQRLQKLKPGDERVEALISAAQRMLDQQQQGAS